MNIFQIKINMTEFNKNMGLWMHQLMLRLYPICRSLAGPGNRETLNILKEEMPLQCIEAPSGSKVFDWVVPNEWVPREAWLVDLNGKKHADFSQHNLNLVSHSEPVKKEMDLDELLPYIYSLPDQPDAVPYVTSYYKKGWGFCMSDREKKLLPKGRYSVHIDTDLKYGSMSLGEVFLPGSHSSKKEILISTYICHPSMANDNLSGVVVAAGLYKLLAKNKQRKLGYRFLFVPETIGSIAWLSMQKDDISERIAAGVVLSCIGNDAPFTWKRSRRGCTYMDRIAQHCIGDNGRCIDFTPVTGSDERQFCSPGFDLNMGLLSRSYPGTFPFYHTSKDTPDKTPSHALADSLDLLYKICMSLEANSIKYKRVDPRGEPMLSKRGLYHSVSVRKEGQFDRSLDPRTALMWVLNFCDGEHELIDIAEQSGLNLLTLSEAAEKAADSGVLMRL
jgi:aminopeptidase-like protein